MSALPANAELHRLHARDAVRGLVPQTFVHVLAEYLQSRGVAAGTLIPATVLASESALGRYPAEAYCQLLLRSAERLDDPLLGFHLGQTLRPSHLGPLGYLLQTCEHLGAALLRILRYHRLLHDINPIRQRVEHDTMVLEWGIAHGRPGALFDEAGITGIVQLTRALCASPMQLLAVDFVNPPPRRTEAYTRYFGCAVRWSQPMTRLVFPVAQLKAPMRQPDPVLRRLMEQQVDTVLATLPDDGDLAERTRLAVARLAGGGMPELEQVAAELRLSPRVYYRRLAAEGLNFRTLREAALHGLARTHLADARLTLAEISALLGYTDQSAFSRAFRRWSGISPLQWRKAALAGPASHLTAEGQSEASY